VSRFAVLAVLLSSVVPVLAADRARPAVPLEIDAEGGIVVEVSVNGSGPYRFLLDTGTSRSIVSDALAGELGAPVVAKSEVVTNAGSEMRLVVSLASLSIAAARVEHVLAPVLPEARLQAIGTGVRGVLGQDFLSAFNYTLDYRHARLTWDEPLTCGGPDAVRLTPADGRFVMTVEQASGAALRLVPDSGTDAPVLFQPQRPRQVRSRIRELRIGSIAWKDVAAVNVERTDPDADGLLPLHRFSTVSFAADGGCLVARK
jgi:predicted aspartyl protease